MKHKKGQCAIFVESRLPCEDCDLEGHSATCGWHIDWHDCSCGAFDNKGIKMKDKTRGIILNDKPVSIIPVHPKMWDQVTEERIQYRDALEKTKKNMMEMERDLYLKINELEKQNKEMKELLKTIYETDCLRDWAFEDDDGNSIADKVRKIVKD
jgi:hypothetical protein